MSLQGSRTTVEPVANDSRLSRETLANGSRATVEPFAPDRDLRPPTTYRDQDQRPGPQNGERQPELKLGSLTASAAPLDTGQSLSVQTVWGHYRQYHPSCPGTLKQGRKEYRLACDRLKDGFNVEALRRAIDGYHRSPFHNGVNDTGAKYLGFELIMRDVDHVNKGIEMADDPTLDKGLSEKTRKTVHALGAWARRNNAAG